MAIFARTLPPGAFTANRARTSFRFVDRRGRTADGVRQLLVKTKGGRLRFRLLVAGTDLSLLRGTDPSYTLALEVGDDTVAITRSFKTSRKGRRIAG